MRDRHATPVTRRRVLILGLMVGGLVTMLCVGSCAQPQADAPLNEGAAGNPYSLWDKGPTSDPDFFPIAVWLQGPNNAERFKAAGINLYIGLWKGPTAEQLDALHAAGMPVICAQNDVGLTHENNDIIVGWMHGDEPDNAQALPEGDGYGPPILPSKIEADYKAIAAADPTRPVLLNLGQGVAYDNYIGRGVRRGHLEDYLEYVKGGDIISFDIYPAVHRQESIAGNLWYVPKGVDRLREWTADRKVVWNCIECTRISNTEVKPTPYQVRAEVWMSLIHGSMGLIYFVHQFQPNFIEAGLLADEEMVAGVTEINQQIQQLAPVLNSPSQPNLVRAVPANKETPVDIMVKAQGDSVYVFAVAMRDAPTSVAFTVDGLPGPYTVEVLGEDRSLPITDGGFTDEFNGYEVHLYRLHP